MWSLASTFRLKILLLADTPRLIHLAEALYQTPYTLRVAALHQGDLLSDAQSCVEAVLVEWHPAYAGLLARLQKRLQDQTVMLVALCPEDTLAYTSAHYIGADFVASIVPAPSELLSMHWTFLRRMRLLRNGPTGDGSNVAPLGCDLVPSSLDNTVLEALHPSPATFSHRSSFPASPEASSPPILDEQTLLTMGPFCLDPQTRKCFIDGYVHALTKVQFDLLAFLMQRPGVCVRRSQLLEVVWQTTYEPDTNLVDAQICRLRRRIRPYHGCIETVRGVGYRLTLPDDAIL